MNTIDRIVLWYIFLLSIVQITGLSINQPKLSSCATWRSGGITFADNNTVGTQPNTVFVTVNNSIYIAENKLNQVQMWIQGNMTSIRTISNGLSEPHGLFVANNGDIYVGNGDSPQQVTKWTLNATNGTIVFYDHGNCQCLFIDINDTLYCSHASRNTVVKTPLTSDGNISIVVAGNGSAGALAHMLDNPHGIYVDVNFNLYIADTNNNRIQLFQLGELNATTVVGNGAPNTITLNGPKGIAFDGNGYLFIADTDKDRILGSSRNGFRCIVGCTGTSGSAANQLKRPWSFSFDSYGNLFVTDQNNARIQKFIIATNSCGLSYNQPKLSSCATWYQNGITFANVTVVGTQPRDLYVDINNTVYVTGSSINRILVWLEGTVDPVRNISGGLNFSEAIFPTITGDVYVDNSYYNSRIDKFTLNVTNSAVEAYINEVCYDIFIDINDNLYYSLAYKVVKKSLYIETNLTTIVAGNGAMGSEPSTLNGSRGIFVDTELNLYVADCYNNRIQFFKPNLQNATTLAGTGAPGTITLYTLTGVILDADGYLFIVDYNNHRVVGSGKNGFRCIVGCSNTTGSASDQLYNPHSISFDSYGNLFVADMNNNRVQKFLLAFDSCELSYNQPKLCSSATWSFNGTTFANVTTIGTATYNIFVDTNNTIFVPMSGFNRTDIWSEGNMTRIRSISGDLVSPLSVFVTNTGDILIDNGRVNQRVDKWTSNATSSVVAMDVNGTCYSLFVDINNNLYCSLGNSHKVVKKLFNDNANTTITIAGNGLSGSAPNMLYVPTGIFVDLEFDLYVADCNNNRIQIFQPGNLNGSTLVVNGSSGTITLDHPIAVMMDADGYLFILEYGRNRILASGPDGFRCIIACVNLSGSLPDQLNQPWSFSFDSHGNIFVVDCGNSRIQKFIFINNSCDVTTTSQNIQTSTIGMVSSLINKTQTTISSQTSLNTFSYSNSIQSSFSSSTYKTPTHINPHYNVSLQTCDLLQPCQNNATCYNHNTSLFAYSCKCSSGFNGSQCQYDNRPCQTNTCWNNGTCNETSNTTFHCLCTSGWTDIRCQTKINYCQNNTCLNEGICQSLLLNFTCKCLGESYSGKHCEITSNKVVVLQTIAKSFGFIAIVAMICVMMFVMIMDVLKYFFNIDPVESIRQESQSKKPRTRKPATIIRYIYVNAPAETTNSSIENIGLHKLVNK